jgi:hypothetical protein
LIGRIAYKLNRASYLGISMLSVPIGSVFPFSSYGDRVTGALPNDYWGDAFPQGTLRCIATGSTHVSGVYSSLTLTLVRAASNDGVEICASPIPGKLGPCPTPPQPRPLLPNP